MVAPAIVDARIMNQRVTVRKAAQFLVHELVIADLAAPLGDTLQAGLEEDEADDDQRVRDQEKGGIEEGDRRADQEEEDAGEEFEAARPLIDLHLFEVPRDQHRGTSLSAAGHLPIGTEERLGLYVYACMGRNPTRLHGNASRRKRARTLSCFHGGVT